jgi:hypothetical protein
MHRILLLVVGVLLVGTAGCGKSQNRLSGTVKFEDGTPLSQGSVVFLKEGYMARGSIQSDGSYTVGSLTENDGLPDGEYQVYIEGAEVEDPQSPSGMRSMVDKKMNSPQTSDLKYKSPEDGEKLDIVVSKPGG